MNILKLQDELKGVPDDALVGYVKNPTGQVPTYLALGELQRRKDMRAKVQIAQPSRTTVAQDIQQAAAPQPMPAPQAQPQAGVAALPTGDMFQDKSFASGGIVAFAGDGPDGSYVDPALYGGPVQEYEPWYKSMKLFGDKYNLYGEGVLGPNPDQDTIRAFNHQRSMNPFISGMPRTDLAEEYGILRNKAAENKATQKDYDRMNEINQSMKPAENYPTGGGATKASIEAMQKDEAARAAKDAQEKALKDKEKALKDMANANAAGSRGTKEGIKSLADYAKEFRDVVGEDPMQAKLMERMDKMDAAAAKQADRAPWMALAQAGFSIAGGKSPYALQNIAAGALEGVKSYGDAQDKMAALEEKRFALMNDMAKSKRAEQLAIASKGADSRDAQLARDQQYQIHKESMANQLQLHVLDNAYEIKKTQIAAAAKDLPNAVERATKIDPIILDSTEYKEGLKALEGKYGDKGVELGSPNHDKYQIDLQNLYDRIYAKKIRNPLAASSFGAGALNYTPGKGFSS